MAQSLCEFAAFQNVHEMSEIVALLTEQTESDVISGVAIPKRQMDEKLCVTF